MSPAQEFLATLQHVMGAALAQAEYGYDEQALLAARGLFRFVKGPNAIEFQTLYHPQSGLSRFRIGLVRGSEESTLAGLIWHDYQARVLPSDDYWWLYKFPRDLAPHLLEAGKLLFAYGLPWLEDWPTDTP